MAPTHAEALRLASGLILLGLLPKSLGGAAGWRLFGSWAILLQSRAVTRLPDDIDIEMSLDESSSPVVTSDWGMSKSGFRLRPSRARGIEFFSRRDSPVAFWQTVEVLHCHQVVAAETVNWVFRESRASGDIEALRARNGNCIDLTECHTFSVAAHALPELARLPLSRVSVASREECVAQKWTRISIPRSGGRRHTRWQDLADVYDLVIGAHAPLDRSLLVGWLMERAREKGLEWPCLLPEPPLEWLDFWDSYNFRSGISRPSPAVCARQLNAYLRACVLETN